MEPLTPKDVLPLSDNCQGKVVVLDATTLLSEYRNPCGQLWLATGGFGCRKELTGTTIMGTCLFDGEKIKLFRGDVIGEATPEQIAEVEAAKIAAAQGSGI